MLGVNKAIIVGNLGRDPEVRMTQSGNKMASFTVATSERWKDPEGTQKEKTEWHRIVIFNPHLAEIAEKYLRKGDGVYVEGQLETRRFQDKGGVERWVTEVTLGRVGAELRLISDKPKGDDRQPPLIPESKPEPAPEADPTADLDDEIPF